MDYSRAILVHDSAGFIFGWDAMRMRDRKLDFRGYDYENSLGLNIYETYTIEEIEIFTVIKPNALK